MKCSPGLEKSPDLRISRFIRLFLWGVIAAAAIFAVLIFVIPLDLYRLIGHCFEACAALSCMTICLYAYRSWSRRMILLLAAFAFGEYALATVFWYLFSLLPVTEMLGRPYVFMTVSEFSFLGFMLFFIAGFQIEQPEKPFPALYAWLVLGIFMSIPLAIAGFEGLTVRTSLLFLRFFIVEQLLVVTVTRGFSKYSLLWAGLCLRVLVSGLYGIRETLFLQNPSWNITLSATSGTLPLYDFFSIIGPLVIASFAFIMLGLLDYTASSGKPACFVP